MAYNVGDAPPITYTAPTVDATVTAVVTPPTGAAATVPATSLGAGQWRLVPVLTLAGMWTVTFTASGTSTDVQALQLLALAPEAQNTDPGVVLPSWAPTLQDVAAHIPTRTRESVPGSVSGDNEYAGTFTTNTTPTGQQALRQITAACRWVAARVGYPVAAEAHGACQVAAALWAAYWIELGYPERDNDLQVYDRLRADAEAAVGVALNANQAAGGGSSLTPSGGAPLRLVYAFDTAPQWQTSRYMPW